MITLSLVFLLAAIVFLVLWLTGTVVLFAGLAKILFLAGTALFILCLIIGVFSKPPKV